MTLGQPSRMVRRVWDPASPGAVLESGQEPEMMPVDQPPQNAECEPPGEAASLSAWFDDSSAPEEVQALRAWVAGLSNELAEARRQREEAQQALGAALAEIAQLRGALADAGSRAAESHASAPPPASAARTDRPPAATPSPAESGLAAPNGEQATGDATEITAELIEAWARTPAASQPAAAPEPPAAPPPEESPPASPVREARASSEPGAATTPAAAAAPTDRREPLATSVPAAGEATSRPQRRSPRLRLLAALVLLLIVAAAVVITTGPRFIH